MCEPPVSSALTRFRQIFEQSPTPYLLLAPDFTIQAHNEAYERHIGRLPGGRVGKPLFEIFPAADPIQRERLQASLVWRFRERRRRLSLKRQHPVAYVAIQSGGADPERYWTLTAIPLADEHGVIDALLCHPASIAELARPQLTGPVASGPAHPETADGLPWRQGIHELRQPERLYLQQLFQQAPGFVCVLRGPRHVFELANEACYRLTGHRHLIGRAVADCLPELVRQGFVDLLDRVLRTGEPYIGRGLPLALQRQPLGVLEQRYIDLVYQPIREPNGEISGTFVQGHDVTEACQLAQELSYQASHDPLTGLLNRREFVRRVTALLEADAGRPNDAEAIEWLTDLQPVPVIDNEPILDGVQESRPHVLMYLDLDLFKIINDHCGHGAGNELLRQVSDLLRRHVRSSDILARLGGDEFALVLRRCPMHAAERVANQLRQAISDLVFIWQGRRYGVSISVGLAAFGVPLGVPFEVALSQADAACFLAKEKGRNRVQIYRDGDDEAHRQLHDMDWASRLRDCLAEDRVVLYMQRIVGLQGEHTAAQAWEVLARLRDVDGTLVAPGAFIPAAERFGLMPALDRHIIRKAFATLHELPESQRRDARYFINVSGRTLSQDDLSSFVQGLLLEFPTLRPEHICFEVTETAAVSNPTVTASAMQHLVDQGFRFALDDFGSGMLSFAYLRQLPVQYVKIDGEFVRDILHDPVDRAMVEAVAKVARLMGIQTVAEFVESAELLEHLAAMGVDYGQGFALHRPEPFSKALEDPA